MVKLLATFLIFLSFQHYYANRSRRNDHLLRGAHERHATGYGGFSRVLIGRTFHRKSYVLCLLRVTAFWSIADINSKIAA